MMVEAVVVGLSEFLQCKSIDAQSCAMRSALSIFIAVTLLMVSSMPMMSDAASCERPAHAMSMLEDMAGEHAVESEQHVYLAALTGDLPLNRIECGCGCHRTIDVLPHLLAPHAFALEMMIVDVASRLVLPQKFIALNAVVARIPVPPPRKLIFS